MRAASLRYRVIGGFALLVTMFLTLVVLLMVAEERMCTAESRRVQAVEQLRNGNDAVLQHMTDAETGLRGLQLTGETLFLEPYTSGRAAAAAELDALEAAAGDAEVRALVTAERHAVDQWLYAYAVPLVNAGVADADAARAERGKGLFDAVRAAHADVDAVADTRLRAAKATTRAEARLVNGVFTSLSLLLALTGLVIARLHQRHLLRPLDDIRSTLRRLAEGELSARATPVGPAEMRALAGSVNELAGRTERLIAAEQARTARSRLVHAVAAELKDDADPALAAGRIAGLIATAFDAPAARCEITDGTHRDQDERDQDQARQGEDQARPGDGQARRGEDQARRGEDQARRGEDQARRDEDQARRDELVAPIRGGEDGPAGVLRVVRPGCPEWTEEETTLLTALADEVGHAVRRHRLRLRQDGLIAELRRLDEQKDVFVATVTHELRTPLTNILGYCEMLDEDVATSLSAAQRRALDVIRRNAARLHATVGDLLLLEEAHNRTGGEVVPVDLAAVAAALHTDLGGPARAKELRSELVAEPAWVRGDRERLERALRCLLENAIKFTPAGGRLECRLTAEGGTVVVAVTDTGIGIPAGDVPGLFTPFHRAANAMDLAVQGTGLGLAIVRTIVAEHGGTVAARSELGRGSTFTMTLPAATRSTPGRGSAAAR